MPCSDRGSILWMLGTKNHKERTAPMQTLATLLLHATLSDCVATCCAAWRCQERGNIGTSAVTSLEGDTLIVTISMSLARRLLRFPPIPLFLSIHSPLLSSYCAADAAVSGSCLHSSSSLTTTVAAAAASQEAVVGCRPPPLPREPAAERRDVDTREGVC